MKGLRAHLHILRNSLGFWLWPMSVLFLSWERFKLFTTLKRNRLNDCRKYKRFSLLHLLSPMPRSLAPEDIDDDE